MSRFSIAVERKPNPRPYWDQAKISIFDGGEYVGSYERSYAAYAGTTFYPFEQEGNWYALYSADYTSTRLMVLPECLDIGGEEPNPQGFCPVEYYVPRYRRVTTEWDAGTKSSVSYRFDNRKPGDRPGSVRPLYDTWMYATFYEPWEFLRTGLVAGCHWGDDVSWKVEALDLSRASEGVLKRDARFGHFELPRQRPLTESVDFGYWEPGRPLIRITREETRDLATGELIDPYDL